MPTFVVYVCDRCAKRAEAWHVPPGWYSVSVEPGWHEDLEEDGPEGEQYVLCNDCAPDPLDRLRRSVQQPPVTPRH